MNAVADGMPISKAGELAGYKSRHNAHDVYRTMRDRMAEVMDSVGLTERAIALRLNEQLYATKTVTASFMGQITDSIEVADNQAVGKAIETAARIRGMVDTGETGPQIGSVNILLAPGVAPAWAGHSTEPERNAVVTESIPIEQQAEGVPISTVEGTGPDPGPSTHIRSAKSEGKGVLTQRVNPGCDRSSSASASAGRVKQKRKPRLPGWRKK